MVNEAWEQRHLVESLSDGMGGKSIIFHTKMQDMRVDMLILVRKWTI